MKISKIAEWLGFVMIVVAFLLWLAADLEFISVSNGTLEITGLVGTIFWSMGYMQSEKEKKEMQ